MTTCSDTGSNKAREDLRDAQERLVEVEQDAKLAREDLDNI